MTRFFFQIWPIIGKVVQSHPSCPMLTTQKVHWYEDKGGVSDILSSTWNTCITDRSCFCITDTIFGQFLSAYSFPRFHPPCITSDKFRDVVAAVVVADVEHLTQMKEAHPDAAFLPTTVTFVVEGEKSGSIYNVAHSPSRKVLFEVSFANMQKGR